MDISEISITLLNESKLKGKAKVTFDDCFVVQDLRVVFESGGYFVSMPNYKLLDGTHGEVAHPTNLETQKMIEEAVLKAYVSHVETSGSSLSDIPSTTQEMSMGGD